jgi:hypothetical protein
MWRANSRAWIGALVGVMILAACGGGGGGSKDKTAAPNTPTSDGSAPYVFTGPTATPRPSAPRNRDVPEGAPYDLEIPFTIGSFVQQSVRGHATGLATGGLQATYLSQQNTVVLTAYYMDDPQQAIDAVRGALESSSVARVVETPHYLAPAAFGIVQDRQGAYLAAWSHYGWVFIVRTPDAQDALNRFMDAFPY